MSKVFTKRNAFFFWWAFAGLVLCASGLILAMKNHQFWGWVVTVAAFGSIGMMVREFRRVL